MDKKIFSFLFSTRLMALLFIVFAVAMAIGTFIESEYNTETARILIYNAWWFEVIMVFFVINFIGNIKRYQLFKKEKWSILVIHLSFIFIILGAFVTRYISYEGVMPIRENAQSNIVYSDKTFLTVLADGDYNGEIRRRTFEYPKYFSPVTDNYFLESEEFNSIPFEIEYEDYIMNAKQTLVESEEGDLYLKMVESGDGNRHDHYLKSGEVQSIHNILYAFNKPTEGAINISIYEDAYFIQTPFEGNFMRMADQSKGIVTKDSLQPLNLRSLYSLAGTQFVFPEPAFKGSLKYESNNDFKDQQTDDVLKVIIRSEGKEEKVTLVGSKGKQGVPQSVKVGNLDFTLFFGSKLYELPFSIKLDDFIADKYPGTEKSYSAFKSKLELIDTEKNTSFKDSVFMNNILDYRGFRFFQAGFDPDEKGTILSVNHDWWGTNITYLGYFLLYFGLMWILFDKKSRFGEIKMKLEKIKIKKSNLIVLFFTLNFLTGYSQEHDHQAPDEQKVVEFLKKYKVSQEHADDFGKMIIQDQGGRMKPINTFSSELLRKVSKNDTFEGMDADQAFLSMTQFPQYWYNVPIIYLKRGNDSIRKLLGISLDVKKAKLIDFFDEKGNYKLAPYLEEAYGTNVPNQFQKDFKETDMRVNLLYSALSGEILRVYPIPNDKNNKWVSYLEINQSTGTALDTVKNLMPIYLDAVTKSAETKNYSFADSLLVGLQKYQLKYGSKVMPSKEKIETEVLYNRYDIFKRLYYLYMIAGVLMLVFTIVQLFTNKTFIKSSVAFFSWLLLFFFGLHTLGLIARWYVSGHAPWSDAYESMIYVAWATMLFGVLFGRKSKLSLAATAFVTSMILMVAHWNWMDPAIANLQPVLNSYWLMIHVAVIVASYGPFTLGMILGIVSLFLMLLLNDNNKKKIKLAIDELSYINEMALTIGLVMLTIGNFLGGQWANESWGRYWGWDPKETWALISIMVYAFVIHARLVPGLRGRWVFNVLSVFAFYSILMTYFGVNFYLTGLHSYASGEKVVTPTFVYVSVALVTLLSIVSYFKYRKHLKS